MDWANEKYVRLFVRDTTTWKLIPWQSKCLLPLIMRKLDRSGVIDLGTDGEDGLAAVIEVPLEFLQSGLPALLKRDVFRMVAGKLVMPNFLAAQEARQSDAQRKRESRENQRLAAMKSQPVTGSPEPSQSQSVTTCHTTSDLVTPDYPQTRPDQTKADPSRARSNDNANGESAVRPRDPQSLLNCLGVAVRREQPQVGLWAPARFDYRDSQKFLASIDDVEAALPEIERKIELFAKDPDMQPWTMAKFVDKYNAIGLPKLEFGRAPKPAATGHTTRVREW
jgi:hypothetical protein